VSDQRRVGSGNQRLATHLLLANWFGRPKVRVLRMNTDGRNEKLSNGASWFQIVGSLPSIVLYLKDQSFTVLVALLLLPSVIVAAIMAVVAFRRQRPRQMLISVVVLLVACTIGGAGIEKARDPGTSVTPSAQSSTATPSAHLSPSPSPSPSPSFDPSLAASHLEFELRVDPVPRCSSYKGTGTVPPGYKVMLFNRTEQDAGPWYLNGVAEPTTTGWIVANVGLGAQPTPQEPNKDQGLRIDLAAQMVTDDEAKVLAQANIKSFRTDGGKDYPTVWKLVELPGLPAGKMTVTRGTQAGQC
jgi:hypothetical protein